MDCSLSASAFEKALCSLPRILILHHAVQDQIQISIVLANFIIICIVSLVCNATSALWSTTHAANCGTKIRTGWSKGVFATLAIIK